MDTSSDLPLWRRLLDTVRRRIVLALVLFGVLVGLGAAYSLSIPTQYTATGVMSFQPREGVSEGRDLTALLASRYPAVVASETAVGKASIAAGVTPSEVSAGLASEVQPSTLNMVITVTLPNATQAMAASQSLYLSALAANDTDPYLEALQTESPTSAVAVGGIPTVVLLAAVVLLSAVASALVTLFVDQMLKRSP